MIADLDSPKTLPPVLPGYRPPFNSETGRAAGLKTQARIREQRKTLNTVPKPIDPKRRSERGMRQLIRAVRFAILKHCNASANSTDPDLAMRHAKLVKLFFDIEQSIYGATPSHKTAYKPHLQKSTMVEPVAPIEPSKSPTIEPASVDQNASQVKPEGKNLTVSQENKPI